MLNQIIAALGIPRVETASKGLWINRQARTTSLQASAEPRRTSTAASLAFAPHVTRLSSTNCAGVSAGAAGVVGADPVQALSSNASTVHYLGSFILSGPLL